MALDFPLVGEKVLGIPLDEKFVRSAARSSEITKLINDQVGERQDKKEIIQGVEEFFVNASQFMQARSKKELPKGFDAKWSAETFVLSKQDSKYLFTIDSSLPKENYFERVFFKIFSNSAPTKPILVLFLIPSECDL